LYQYNSGGADNGLQKHKESFKDFEEALTFLHKLNMWLKNRQSTSEFAQNYCWDGYLERIDGLYKITEEQIGWI
jgi:hypothetical protein